MSKDVARVTRPFAGQPGRGLNTAPTFLPCSSAAWAKERMTLPAVFQSLAGAGGAPDAARASSRD
jgi:hypothetical protein